MWEIIRANRVTGLLWQTYVQFNRDHSNMQAAAVAYSLLFSIFPFALAMLCGAGYVISSPEIQEEVIRAIGNLIPAAREMIVHTLESVVRTREATGILAMLMLTWSALAFFDALRNALNRAWGEPEGQNFIRSQLMNISMLVLAVMGLIAFTWCTTAINYLHESNLQLWIFKFGRTSPASRIILTAASVLSAYGVILLLYSFVPSKRPAWRHIWLGALLAAASFEVVRYSFVWYVKNFAGYNLIYGPISSVIVLLMFIYITAWVLLFFAKFSYVRMRRVGSPGATPVI